jgi:hypothetical protein
MHLIGKDKEGLRVKGWKKIFQANGIWQQAGIATPKADIVVFKLQLVRSIKTKEGHFIYIKELIHQENITIVNLQQTLVHQIHQTNSTGHKSTNKLQ